MFKPLSRLRKCAVAFCMFFLLPLSLFAGMLKGKIVDEKGQPLSFATVYVFGTTIGTNANAQGDYTLPLEPGKYKVVCQFVGYKQSTFNVTILGDDPVVHNFSMQDLGTDLKEVVVRANDEDPAYRIIRKTIARRKSHLKQMKSFQAGIYLKGVMRTRNTPDRIFGQKIDKSDVGVDSTGKGVMYLCEENADYYSVLPNKERTIIHSVKESGSPNGVGFSEFPEVVNFYENNIDLSDQLNPRGFISPISENALLYYKYKLLGEFKENGQVINKIKVTPRRQYEPCFSGTIYIVDGEYAIHSLDMLLTNKSNMDLCDTFMIRQLFIPAKNDIWVIKSQVLYPTIKIFGFDITGSFVTVYDRQKVNEPIPDSIFTKNKKVVSSYDDNANQQDSSFWETSRPIPLEEDEVKDYVVKDSINKVVSSPEYRDSMRRKSNHFSWTDPLLGGVSYNGKDYKTRFEIAPVIKSVEFNTVEGWNLAPKITANFLLDTGKILRTETAVRYGFSNTHFNAISRIYYQQNDRKLMGKVWMAGVEGGKYVFQFNPENPIDPFFNTVSSLYWQHNYMKIYERWEATAFFTQSMGNGFKWTARLGYQKRLPLENTTDFSWYTNSAYSDNTPTGGTLPWQEHSAVLAHLGISYQPGYTYTQYPKYKVPHNNSEWPVFTLSYDKGIPNLLDSKVDFDKWRFSVAGDVRLRMLGNLNYNFATGGFLNDKYVGIPDMMHLNGNELAVASPYLQSFQLASYYKFSNTARLYGEAHVEYYLKGLLTNKIPLLRQARWYLILGNNTFYAGDDHYHTEAFVGIDNLGWKIYRAFRVDFVHSWDSFNQQYNGIRVGLKMGPFAQKPGTGTSMHLENW